MEDILPKNDQMIIIQKSFKSILDNMKEINFGKILKSIDFTVEELKCVKELESSI